MSNLVYLMTGLPSLTFGQVPPITMSEFYHDAKNQLSSAHFNMLESADLQAMDEKLVPSRISGLSTLFREIGHDLTEVRHARTQNRQPRLERLPLGTLTGNPLEREKKILQYEWEELDTIEAGKTFTMTEVIVYKLKLQILIRLHSFNVEKGAQVLASIVNPSTKK